MASLSHFLVLFLIVCVSANDSKNKLSAKLETPDVSTTQKPSTVQFKQRLEQLKLLEESTLKGWYDMVEKFLMLIKPDDKILENIIDYIQGTVHFEFPSSVTELAKQNSVFLTIISLCLAYVIVMFFAGLFFTCCRFCGRCGAKKTQRQTRSINCWRTTHKFCLVFMIAFLVVPIMCMSIINEHMKKSFPSIKSNASGLFTVISTFANDTEQEVNDIAKEQLSNIISSVQNKENFQIGFATPLENDIYNSLNNESLGHVKDLVSWVVNIKQQYVPEVEILLSEMSRSIDDIKNIVKNLTIETERFENHCSQSGSNVCKMAIEKLSVDKLNVTDVRAEIDKKLREIKQVDSEELGYITEKIQTKTLLKDMISKRSDELRKFADSLKPKQEEILDKLKQEVKKYADGVRYFANNGQHSVDLVLGEADKYEHYRWWIMLGLAVILLIPVAFLCLGLICGCCGQRKGYHPSKRSSTSHCGGMCLILAVYYFFLVAWLLMLLTIALFLVGGNIQSFVCVPLYEQNFDILDQVSEKFVPEDSYYKKYQPSKVLNDCSNDLSIFEALDLINGSSATVLERELEKRLDGDIEVSLKANINKEMGKIMQLLNDFAQALNLTHEKDLPDLLSEPLSEVKKKIKDTKDQVIKSVPNDTEFQEDLHLLEKSAQALIDGLNSFENQVEHLKSLISKVYEEARGYVGKITFLQKDVMAVEAKVPELVHAQLLQYVMSVVNTDITDKLTNVGHCEPLWVAFDTARTVMCNFIVYPVNGFWFGLLWSLIFIIPTIIFAVKLSRHYLRMKYEDDVYRHDDREIVVPLDEMSRSKPFSYTNPTNMNWMPQNYMVHPATNNHIRQFDYK